MTGTDPAAILARAAQWADALRERGQIDDAAAARLQETLDQSIGERLDQQDDPLLVVMLCGPTAVGKSSLINALAGADISRPGLGATTRAAVLYVHEADDAARLCEYSHLFHGDEQPQTELVRHCRDELRYKILVDTPDIDSIRLQHRELTARLVHAADLVLFVTSPEKYKVLRSARWILEQRQQRGLAFVLNKWDREALGRQHDRRREVEDDFRRVLAEEGFSNAQIFKVSALPVAVDGAGADAIENELPALQAWLETGLNQSTAAMIRQRRLRAAWGRLAGEISRGVPRKLSTHPFLPELTERLAASGESAAKGVRVEASLLEPSGLEDSFWPVTPGPLGMWTRTRHRLSSSLASFRTGLSLLKTAGDLPRPSLLDPAFGGGPVLMLSKTIGQLVEDAAAERLALGPVAASWLVNTHRLDRELAPVPLDVAAEYVAEAQRVTFRRVAGTAGVYAFETLMVLVLVVAVVRVGIGFVEGSYALRGLFATALELDLALFILGHVVASLFFPPLRQRVRRNVARRAHRLVVTAMKRAQASLDDQVEAVDRLVQEGRDLLLQIDQTMVALTIDTADSPGVDRLFGQSSQPRLVEQLADQPYPESRQREEPVRRRPSFD